MRAMMVKASLGQIKIISWISSPPDSPNWPRPEIFFIFYFSKNRRKKRRKRHRTPFKFRGLCLTARWSAHMRYSQNGAICQQHAGIEIHSLLSAFVSIVQVKTLIHNMAVFFDQFIFILKFQY